MRSFSNRYALLLCALAYTAALLGLHALGQFPKARFYDISRFAGEPRLNVRGRVIDFPITRWGKTRFLLQAEAVPLHAFQGRVVVNLDFAVEDLAPGEFISLGGWLSRPRKPRANQSFDEQAYWGSQGAYSVLRVWSPRCFQRLRAERSPAWQFHQDFKAFWFSTLPPTEAALLCGITMGSRGLLPLKVKEQCVRAGIYHILVISGQNMALIIVLGMGLLRLMRIPMRRGFWICCPAILFYTCAVGGDPPVLRAAVMALVLLGVRALKRDVPGHVPFTLAWLWILIKQPETLFGASFQLSFVATASLLAVLPWVRLLQPMKPAPLRWMIESLAVSIAVYVGVWPFLVAYFRQVSVIGLFASVVTFPVSGFLMVSGLVVGTWGVLFPASVPIFLINGLHQVLKVTLIWIAWMSHWPWAILPVQPLSKTVCVIYYTLLICILWKIRHGKNPFNLSRNRGRL